MKQSSPEYAQMQRERIRKTKPWLKSTGAKTIEGKNISKMNALKSNPEVHELMKWYKRLMKEQAQIIRAL